MLTPSLGTAVQSSAFSNPSRSFTVASWPAACDDDKPSHAAPIAARSPRRALVSL
jgi:hypothetical protein